MAFRHESRYGTATFHGTGDQQDPGVGERCIRCWLIFHVRFFDFGSGKWWVVYNGKISNRQMFA